MAQAGHGQDWEQFLVAPNNNPGVPLNEDDFQPQIPAQVPAPVPAPLAVDEGGRRPVFRRRGPTPLNLLCQIQVKYHPEFVTFLRRKLVIS